MSEFQKKLSKKKILEPLNEQQRLPVKDYEGASIVLAGAGAGKTKMLVSRTAYMIADGIDPANILLFTFTRKAANEIKERVIKSIGEEGKEVTIGTYHSFCCRLLRKYVGDLDGPWKRNFSIYDDDDIKGIIKDILKTIENDKENPIRHKEVAGKISKWKEHMMSPVQAKTQAAQKGEKGKRELVIAEIYERYNQAIHENNAFDFDDLIYYAIRLFEKRPNVERIISNRYKYIVVDESQDSGARDLTLITHLMGKNNNICLVGDDYQSIYSFRGSDINLFFDFVEKHHLKKFYLDRNYRSTQVIVNAAQQVVNHNEGQFEKHLFSKNKKGEKIVSFRAPSAKMEGTRVTQIVKALKNHGYKYSDIAVLYRISSSSRRVEDSFMANSIPYAMRSGTPFYARSEIKDIMSYLRFAFNMNDQVALERALRRPKKGLGDKAIENVLTTCFCNDLYDTMNLNKLSKLTQDNAFHLRAKAKSGWDSFLENIRFIVENAERPPVDTIETLINRINYIKFLQDSYDDEEEFQSRKANVEELMNLSADYTSLEEFIEDMTLNETEQEEDGGQADQVNLMTIHGSKGLEFRAVILIDACEERIPCVFSDIEEERRLFYVAMTRAKELLFITNAKTGRDKKGYDVERRPSRFLSEIGKDFIIRR